MSLIKQLARIRSMQRKTRRGWRSGVAAVEFALTLPIWITLMLGMADAAYFVLVCGKADRIAYTVTNIVTQYTTITKADLKDILLAAPQLMQPVTFGQNGVVVISSIYQPPGQGPIIKWQYTGGGTATQVSQIGSMGSAAQLPNGLTLNDGDNVIVSEVYFNFVPMFVASAIVPSSSIYRVAIYKPRQGALITPPT